MPEEVAVAFITHVGKTPALQAEIERLRGPGVLKQLVELAAAQGYEFTEEEYRQAVVQLADGALSDEALDEVLRETGLK